MKGMAVDPYPLDLPPLRPAGRRRQTQPTDGAAGPHTTGHHILAIKHTATELRKSRANILQGVKCAC